MYCAQVFYLKKAYSINAISTNKNTKDKLGWMMSKHNTSTLVCSIITHITGSQWYICFGGLNMNVPPHLAHRFEIVVTREWHY